MPQEMAMSKTPFLELNSEFKPVKLHLNLTLLEMERLGKYMYSNFFIQYYHITDIVLCICSLKCLCDLRENVKNFTVERRRERNLDR